MADRLTLDRQSDEEMIGAQRKNGNPPLARSAAARPNSLPAAGGKLPEARRLIVLIPNSELSEDAHLPQRIWQLASPGKVPVVYLANAQDYDSEMSARRRLSLLAAVTRDRHVPVEIRITHESSWVNALREIVQPGDIVLANAEQTVKKGLFGSEALCDQLGRCLSVPVYVLSGFARGELRLPTPFPRLALSAGLLVAILAGSFALDAQVITQLKGTLQQVILLIFLVIEVGAIWVWNGWTG